MRVVIRDPSSVVADDGQRTTPLVTTPLRCETQAGTAPPLHAPLPQHPVELPPRVAAPERHHPLVPPPAAHAPPEPRRPDPHRPHPRAPQNGEYPHPARGA